MKNLSWLFLFAALLVGCATFRPQAVLEAPDPQLRIEIGPDAQGRADVMITGAPLAEAIVYGQAEKRGPSAWDITLTSLRWFSNWPNGWTDGSFYLSGTLLVEKTDQGWVLRAVSLPVVEGVAKASVRYFDTFLFGENAAQQLSARWDRIAATTAYLRTQFPEGWIENRELVGRFLFPEVYGYSANEPPGKDLVIADSVGWDRNYTAAHFPSTLAAIRESGTLLRDFQETPGLWRLLYHWKNLWASEVSLVLKKTR